MGEARRDDEIDLEFLGNVSGQPYTLHTNIFADGTGRKEQQFRIWFDPTADFHTYSIFWTPRHIILLVDDTPIREFNNHANRGVPYPSVQRIRLYGSLWDAEDWLAAPFVATTSSLGGYYYDYEMDGAAKQKMKRKRDECMIYDYCTNTNRVPKASECSMP